MPKKNSPSGAAKEMYIPNYTMLDFGFSQGDEASYKDSPSGAEKMHIPDYTMLDFGFPEGTRFVGSPRSR